jgi:DNA topoisomerase-3
MPPPRVRALFVAEKPSIAKTLADVLSNHHHRTRQSPHSNFNHNFDFDLDLTTPTSENIRYLSVTVTSVCGHLMAIDLADKHAWKLNSMHVFDDRITEQVNKGSEGTFRNLTTEAAGMRVLVIWTDCDREGEAIGAEVVRAVQSVNQHVLVRRARFSAANHADLWRAVNSLRDLNENEVRAVEARSEIDLRLGAAFTRTQTVMLRQRFHSFTTVVSFGSCQFPTLGFVVARFEANRAFVPEVFYSLRMSFECARRAEQAAENNGVVEMFHFTWDRNRMFDWPCAFACYQVCMDHPTAVVCHVTRKPKHKWRPLPLSTVEFQVRASKWCRVSSETAMKAAEVLYQKGIISYPRTETEVFSETFDLRALVAEQRASQQWGAFASYLLDQDGFALPRVGTKNDQAHPPIHPLRFVSPTEFSDENEKRVYELVVRHFLACCAKDAVGSESVVRVRVAGEGFTAKGLVVHERNYLDVYVFERWGDKAMPDLREGQEFAPSVLEMHEGTTTAPELLSEAELIRLMDTNGIGTDATIADHIKTVQEREYVVKDNSSRFRPTELGLALVRSYNHLGLDRAISKPDLRAELERDLARICRGEVSKEHVVQTAINKYRVILQQVVDNRDAFLASVASNLSDHQPPSDEDFSVVVSANVSKCGVCGVQACMQVKLNPKNETRALVCRNGCPGCFILPRGFLHFASKLTTTTQTRGKSPHDQKRVRYVNTKCCSAPLTATRPPGRRTRFVPRVMRLVLRK